MGETDRVSFESFVKEWPLSMVLDLSHSYGSSRWSIAGSKTDDENGENGENEIKIEGAVLIHLAVYRSRDTVQEDLA